MYPETEVIEKDTITKKILTPGNSRISQKPSEGSKCILNIKNIKRFEENGEESMESNLLEILRDVKNSKILTGAEEVELIIGEADSDIDKRIERAIQLMKDHECALIKISTKDASTDPKDPSTDQKFSMISFEATLMKHERFKPIWEWTPEEKYNIAMRYKEAGVKIYKESQTNSHRYKDAFYRFSKACKILISLEPIDDLNLDKTLQDNILTLRLRLYNNMAACQAKSHNYYQVIELCSKVLARNDKDPLSLLQRGNAYGELRDYDRAVQDFTKLSTIQPSNEKVRMGLQRYRLCLQKANNHCNAMIKRMFKS